MLSAGGRGRLVSPTFMAKARTRLSKVAIPHIRGVVLHGYVSSSHELFPFNGPTKPFTSPTPGYRVLR